MSAQAAEVSETTDVTAPRKYQWKQLLLETSNSVQGEIDEAINRFAIRLKASSPRQIPLFKRSFQDEIEGIFSGVLENGGAEAILDRLAREQGHSPDKTGYYTEWNKLVPEMTAAPAQIAKDLLEQLVNSQYAHR